jgi:hypothetical protein
MTNGIDHNQGGGNSETPAAPPKPAAKPAAPKAPPPQDAKAAGR